MSLFLELDSAFLEHSMVMLCPNVKKLDTCRRKYIKRKSCDWIDTGQDYFPNCGSILRWPVMEAE